MRKRRNNTKKDSQLKVSHKNFKNRIWLYNHEITCEEENYDYIPELPLIYINNKHGRIFYKGRDVKNLNTTYIRAVREFKKMGVKNCRILNCINIER